MGQPVTGPDRLAPFLPSGPERIMRHGCLRRLDPARARRIRLGGESAAGTIGKTTRSSRTRGLSKEQLVGRTEYYANQANAMVTGPAFVLSHSPCAGHDGDRLRIDRVCDPNDDRAAGKGQPAARAAQGRRHAQRDNEAHREEEENHRRLMPQRRQFPGQGRNLGGCNVTRNADKSGVRNDEESASHWPCPVELVGHDHGLFPVRQGDR